MSELGARVEEAHKALARASFAVNYMLTKRRINREQLDGAIEASKFATQRLEEVLAALPEDR